MKIPAIATYLALAAFALPAAAQSLNSSVSASARAQIRTDHKRIRGSSADTDTQRVSLLITLSGALKSPESRTVKWFIFGRNVKSNKVTVIKSGDEPLALDGLRRQSIETKEVTTTHTPDHAVVSRSSGRSRGGRSSGRSSTKRVQGSGVKYIGYGVQVMDGDTVVGKVFMSPGLEAEVK